MSQFDILKKLLEDNNMSYSLHREAAQLMLKTALEVNKLNIGIVVLFDPKDVGSSDKEASIAMDFLKKTLSYKKMKEKQAEKAMKALKKEIKAKKTVK